MTIEAAIDNTSNAQDQPITTPKTMSEGGSRGYILNELLFLGIGIQVLCFRSLGQFLVLCLPCSQVSCSESDSPSC